MHFIVVSTIGSSITLWTINKSFRLRRRHSAAEQLWTDTPSRVSLLVSESVLNAVLSVEEALLILFYLKFEE